MFAMWNFLFFLLYQTVFAEKPNVEPEYLNMLRETGRHEEFAKLLGLEDVSLVHPLEGRTEEDLIFTNVSPLGDILLTPEQQEESRQGIRLARHTRKRWTNHVMPYTISSDYSSSQAIRIQSAIDYLNDLLPYIQMVPRTNEKDYVHIFNGQGCYSNLGRVGGQQPLSLQSNGCMRSGTIMHEMLHAMGMIHEHSRPDQEEYVEVLYENIPQDWHSQYRKMSLRDFEILGDYDPYSVMHYPMRAPNGKLAFRFLDPTVNTAKVGQRNEPSAEDRKKANRMYSK